MQAGYNQRGTLYQLLTRAPGPCMHLGGELPCACVSPHLLAWSVRAFLSRIHTAASGNTAPARAQAAGSMQMRHALPAGIGPIATIMRLLRWRCGAQHAGLVAADLRPGVALKV